MILRSVVEMYVKAAEPVGSKAVVEALGSTVSSATVRSEMAELESMGLLEQPHTSAGRIPSSAGYRLYVNQLMQSQDVSRDDASVINSALYTRTTEQTNLLDEVGSLTSRLTTYPAYAMASSTGIVSIARFDLIYVDSYSFIIVALLSNDTVKNKLVHLTTPFNPQILAKISSVFNASFTGVPEERITATLISATERALSDRIGLVAVIAGFVIELLVEAKSVGARVSGAANLLSLPEYRDVDKAQKIIRYLSDAGELARLPSPDMTGEIKITIGAENLADELRDSSVVAVRYDAGGDMQGLIGVVGPTRMDYSKVAAHLSYIAGGLSRLLANTNALPRAITKPNEIGDENIGEN
ncbi:MAG: heat-inducible transcriptional repressor HrcA [Oscillospiraceae bacterium]|nr:heat-inducible transcriptional repressor HrcA [Oscillospiraceae bacterium]MCL2279094.1 heat-inducible transcriptional repressor HrcA [Oscillospiraceae bacterium]